MAETINGLYKAEVIHKRGPWRSLQAVELATLEWVDWFNNRRLFGPISIIPPAEAEQITIVKLPSPSWRRDSSKTVSGKPGAIQSMNEADCLDHQHRRTTGSTTTADLAGAPTARAV